MKLEGETMKALKTICAVGSIIDVSPLVQIHTVRKKVSFV